MKRILLRLYERDLQKKGLRVEGGKGEFSSGRQKLGSKLECIMNFFGQFQFSVELRERRNCIETHDIDQISN